MDSIGVKNCFLKSIIAFSLLFIGSSIYAQNPFDYGQTDSIYFISSNRIDTLGFEFIYVVDKLNETGGMNEDIDLTIIDFSSHHSSLHDGWYAGYDTTAQIPILDSLISQALFINGYFWDYENDTLSGAGMEGYGTLCTSYYENEKGYTLVETMCKRETTVEYRKIHYHDNGLPSYWVCCEWVNDDEYDEYDNNPLPPAYYVVYSDTTYLIYDSEWRYLGLKERNHADFKAVFNEEPAKHYSPFYQAYLDKVPMERYMETHIGFKPKRILIEIYRKAALMFIFDVSIEKYVQLETIVLE